MNDWFYFGCHKQTGHYLFRVGMHYNYEEQFRKLTGFDGLLAPQNNFSQGLASISRLAGLGYTALALWDYTVDKRPMSNSIFFAPSLTISEQEMINQAVEKFPEVWNRIGQVQIINGELK